MKKKKSNKLKMIWQKMKKPLMILSFVGNILFLLFVIVGCVGQKKAQQTNASENASNIDTLADSVWVINEYVEFNPNGDAFISEPFDTLTYLLDFTLYTGDLNTSMINFESGVNRYYKLGFYSSSLTGTIDYYTSENDYDVVWRIDNEYNEYWENDNFRYIYIRGGANAESRNLINWFSNYGSLISQGHPQTFTFNKYFNYNAPQKQPSNSMFVPHHFDNPNELGFEVAYDLPTFYSNNQPFDTIRIWYWSGNATRYQVSDTQTAVNDNTDTAYYGFMQYKNSVTGYTIEVNSRAFNTQQIALNSNDTQTFLVKGSYWTNENYRTLLFSAPLTAIDMNKLAQFNSEFDENGFAEPTSNIGLGNVFTLLGSAFGGLTALWSVQILPGISLGLLIFLPLIVTVIIVIIKLVKR